MDKHARTCWVVTETPWFLENHLIAIAESPLNIRGAPGPFCADLRRLRSSVKRIQNT